MGCHASIRIAYALDINIYNAAGKLIETEKASPGFQAFIFAAIFPLGFLITVSNGAELFTGNTMYMMPGLLHGQIKIR